MEMKRHAVVLLGRGGYSDAPKVQLAGLVKRLECTITDNLVLGAFVDQATPSLPQALDECAESGARRILVVPVYVPDDRNLGAWILKLIKRWMANHAGEDVHVSVSRPLGDHEAIAEAVVQIASDPVSGDHVSQVVGLSDNGEPGWSVIPPHKYHLLQCRGPRCTARGSGDTWDHLNGRLQDEGMLDKDVLVAQTGCLYPCNLGPVMVVYPEGVWYCGMDRSAADRVVGEHFGKGQVVSDYARTPAPQAQRMPDPSS